jgi:hypothetical protein
MLASGDTLRRAVSDAGSNQSFAGEQRAYRPMAKNISAGSKAQKYRAGLLADAQAASTNDFRSAYLDQLAANAQAGAAFDRSSAQERDSLRRLLLDTEGMARTSDLEQRQAQYYQELKKRERKARSRQAEMERGAGTFGFLAGLFS